MHRAKREAVPKPRESCSPKIPAHSALQSQGSSLAAESMLPSIGTDPCDKRIALFGEQHRTVPHPDLPQKRCGSGVHVPESTFAPGQHSVAKKYKPTLEPSRH